MEIRNPHLAQYATGIAEEDIFLLEFSAYLFKVINGTAARFWNRNKRRMAHEVLTDVQSFSKLEAIQPEDVSLSAVQLDEVTADTALSAAICSLPKRQREVLAAYVLQGRTVEEIAKEQDVSQSAIYALLRRGIARMRVELYGRKSP